MQDKTNQLQIERHPYSNDILILLNMKKAYLFAAMASLVLVGCLNKDEVKNPNEMMPEW